MAFWRILLVGLGAQCIFLGAGMAILGLGGGLAFLGPFRAGWLDVPNTFLPIWFAIDLIGVALIGLAYRRARAKTALLALGALGLIAAGVPIGAELAARAQQALAPPGKGAPLRVMSFNSFEGNFAPGRVVASIYRTNPDIIALQEPINLLRWLRQLDGLYPYRTPCQAVNCRLLILSKLPLTNPRTFTIPGYPGQNLPYRDGDLDIAEAEATAPDGRTFTLITTHMGWPAPPQNKRRQQDLLFAYLKPLARERLIVTGDFNLTPWAFTMRRQDQGLRPLRRVTRALPTWPAVIPRLNRAFDTPLLPIDHVYVGPAWRSAEVSRLPGAASDHFPLLIDLRAD